MSRVIALCLIALGTFGLAIATYWSTTPPRFELVSVPFRLNTASVQVEPFIPDTDYEYVINIYFSKIKEPRFVCLIGAGNGPPFYPFRCQLPPLLNVSWTVFRQGKTIAHGTSADFQSYVYLQDKTTAVRVLGYFYGVSHVPHQLKIAVRTSAGSFDAYNPRLSIEAISSLGMGWTSQIMWTGVVSMIALIIGLGSFFVFARKAR